MPKKAQVSIPKWKEALALISPLPLRDAASAFANVDIFKPDGLNKREADEVLRWDMILCELIHRGQLKVEDDEAQATNWHVSSTELMKLCDEKGFPYPLPWHVPAPPRSDLDAAHVELERLRLENSQLTERLSIAESGLAKLGVEHDALMKEHLEGKSRSTMLKILGGVVVGAYKIDIHAKNIKGIKDLIDDLRNVGVLTSEKTLSIYLKEAAEHVEQLVGADKNRPK